MIRILRERWREAFPFGVAWRVGWALRLFVRRRSLLIRQIEGMRQYTEPQLSMRLSRWVALAWVWIPHGRWVIDSYYRSGTAVSRIAATRAVWRAEAVQWWGASVGNCARSVATLYRHGLEIGDLYADPRGDNGYWRRGRAIRVRRCVLRS